MKSIRIITIAFLALGTSSYLKAQTVFSEGGNDASPFPDQATSIGGNTGAIQGTLLAGIADVDIYSFSVSATIPNAVISATGGDGDTDLILMNSTFNPIAADDLSGPGFSPSIQITLNPGTYYLAIGEWPTSALDVDGNTIFFTGTGPLSNAVQGQVVAQVVGDITGGETYTISFNFAAGGGGGGGGGNNVDFFFDPPGPQFTTEFRERVRKTKEKIRRSKDFGNRSRARKLKKKLRKIKRRQRRLAALLGIGGGGR